MQPWGSQAQDVGDSLSPGPVEQFDFRQAFAYHGGKEKGKEYTADQHVVVVIL